MSNFIDIAYLKKEVRILDNPDYSKDWNTNPVLQDIIDKAHLNVKADLLTVWTLDDITTFETTPPEPIKRLELFQVITILYEQFLQGDNRIIAKENKDNIFLKSQGDYYRLLYRINSGNLYIHDKSEDLRVPPYKFNNDVNGKYKSIIK